MPPRPASLTVAALLTLVSGVAFVRVAVAVLAARVATFSVGIAVMLALYGVLVAGVGVALWRQRRMAFGAAVTCSLIHVLVLGNLARANHSALFGPLCLVPLAVIVCLFTPASRRALQWG